jgi:hypothetical protein
MPPASDLRLLVLHGLQLKGHAPASALAVTIERPVADVARELRSLAGEGLVVERTGAPAGWGLTTGGRRVAGDLVSAEVDEAGARLAVERSYRRFRALNAGVLDACSRWQVRTVAGEDVVNDHTDPAYDARVVADLAGLQERAEPLLADLAGALDRYRSYGPRLRHAVDRVEAGDGRWFTKPAMPSYHTVWFELHEDLLTTLGLDRSAEDDATDPRSGAARVDAGETGSVR